MQANVRIIQEVARPVLPWPPPGGEQDLRRQRATGKIRGRFFAKSLLSPGLVGAAILCAAATARAAAIGLTITPSAFTNDFVGKFALAIANLTSGMTVTVEQYNDLNTNGIIDADDLLVGSFQVTDGLVPLLAGIRNLNVPGDDDGLTNGQILVQYNYPGVEGAILAGKFLFRVSDPKGLLTSVTQACSVAQHIYPQIVTGRVTASGTGRPLTNCILGAVSFGSPAQVMLTDTNGFYSFYGVPPAYVVFGFNSTGSRFQPGTARLAHLRAGRYEQSRGVPRHFLHRREGDRRRHRHRPHEPASGRQRPQQSGRGYIY